MSELGMARRIDRRAAAVAREGGLKDWRDNSVLDWADDNPSNQATKTELEKLLGYLTAYIPVGVVTGFVPVWSAVVASELPPSPGQTGTPVAWATKLTIAVVTALLAAGLTWALAQQRADARTKAGKSARQPILRTFVLGWFDITAAAIAAFTWATVAPRSWAGLTEPFATVGIAAAVGGALAIAAALNGTGD